MMNTRPRTYGTTRRGAGGGRRGLAWGRRKGWGGPLVRTCCHWQQAGRRGRGGGAGPKARRACVCIGRGYEVRQAVWRLRPRPWPWRLSSGRMPRASPPRQSRSTLGGSRAPGHPAQHSQPQAPDVACTQDVGCSIALHVAGSNMTSPPRKTPCHLVWPALRRPASRPPFPAYQPQPTNTAAYTQAATHIARMSPPLYPHGHKPLHVRIPWSHSLVDHPHP